MDSSSLVDRRVDIVREILENGGTDVKIPQTSDTAEVVRSAVELANGDPKRAAWAVGIAEEDLRGNVWRDLSLIEDRLLDTAEAWACIVQWAKDDCHPLWAQSTAEAVEEALKGELTAMPWKARLEQSKELARAHSFVLHSINFECSADKWGLSHPSREKITPLMPEWYARLYRGADFEADMAVTRHGSDHRGMIQWINVGRGVWVGKEHKAVAMLLPKSFKDLPPSVAEATLRAAHAEGRGFLEEVKRALEALTSVKSGLAHVGQARREAVIDALLDVIDQ